MSDTCTPRAPNIEAYSMPMTPAPTTTIEWGMRFSFMMSSLEMMTSPSGATPGTGPG